MVQTILPSFQDFVVGLSFNPAFHAGLGYAVLSGLFARRAN
jgi:hypothetical protein